MAAVIHSLWEKGDRNPLILPANIPIDDPRVQFELTRYLSDNWVPVIEKDVDGPNSLPLRIDGEVPNLGKFARDAGAWRARSTWARRPPPTAAHRGLEDRRVKLGCVMPGESPAVFGDALRRLAGGGDLPLPGRPALLVLDAADGHQAGRGPRRAAQARPRQGGAGARPAAARRPAQDGRLQPHPPAAAVGRRTCPTTSTRAWSCCGIDHPYSKEPGSAAEAAAKAILESRGNTPRLYRNTLVFLAADKTRLQDLDEAVRRYLAWESILAEKDALEPRPAPGEAGRDPEGRRRRRRDGAAPRDLPVAAGAGAGDRRRRPSSGRRSGSPGRTRSRCARARSCGTTSCSSPASPARGCGWSSTGSRSGAATTSREAARRGLRPLSLPAAPQGPRGAGRRRPRRRRAADLGAGDLRLRRQLRRGARAATAACVAGSSSP